MIGLAVVEPASASSILIFGGGNVTNAPTDLQSMLEGLGHTVTNVATTSTARALTAADFAGIDTAWHVGLNASDFTGGTAAAFDNFLNACT